MRKWKLAVPVFMLMLGVFILFTGCGKQSSQAAGKYEYKFVSRDELFGGSLIKAKLSGKLPELEQKALNTLNELGDQGWELVQIADGIFYFKRVK